jgi:hypothetical protein
MATRKEKTDDELRHSLLNDINQILKNYEVYSYNLANDVFYGKFAGFNFKYRDFGTEGFLSSVNFSITDGKSLFSALKTVDKVRMIRNENDKTAEPQNSVLSIIDDHSNPIPYRESDFKIKGAVGLSLNLQDATLRYNDEVVKTGQLFPEDITGAVRGSDNDHSLIFLNFTTDSIIIRSSKTDLDTKQPFLITDKKTFLKIKHGKKEDYYFDIKFLDNYTKIYIRYGTDARMLTLFANGIFKF